MSATLPGSHADSELREMQAHSYAADTRLVGYHDLNGHGDGMQLIKHGQFTYVAHLGTSAMALSILDCADPANPRLVRQIEHPPNTHRHKVQIVGNVLIQNSEVPYFMRGKYETDDKPVTGLCVFDLSDPTDPVQIGFHPVPAKGVHRIWYAEPPYAHIAAHLPDVRERAYQIVDLSNPREPTMAGCWWIPGTRDGDPDPWEPFGEHAEFHVHGIIPNGNRAYVSCVDAGFALLDITDVNSPRVLGRVNWAPNYAGYLHTALPLPSRGLVVGVTEAIKLTEAEDGDKRIWMIDVKSETNPVTIASFPKPTPPKSSPWQSFWECGGRFGPHNVHENRPGSFQSDRLIFSTWYNAGLRIHDISDPDRPEEVGSFIPPAPPGQPAAQINDVFVDADGLIYLSDRIHGGMYIVEYANGRLSG